MDRAQTLSLNATVFAIFLGGWWSSLYSLLTAPTTRALRDPTLNASLIQYMVVSLLTIGIPFVLFIFVRWIRATAVTGVRDSMDTLLASIFGYGCAVLVCVVFFAGLELQAAAGLLLLVAWAITSGFVAAQ